MNQPNYVAHIDSDCFYVSAERVRNPTLRGVPVGVLGNQGACVIAKSYEMKAAGVKTGTPIWDAIKICPDGVYVKRDFHWYEVISRKLLALLKTVSPLVEYYSIDEMFFDADQLCAIFGKTLEKSMEALQQKVKDEIGIPVSIGIAHTKTLAKLGSDTAKPFGCKLMDGDRRAILRDIPAGELCGVGRRSEKKLIENGIVTCWDFVQADRLFIRNLLTIKGEALWYELNGEAVQPIVTSRPPHKAIARGGSVGRQTTDRDRLNGFVVRNSERLIDALDYHQVHSRLIVLSLEYNGEIGWCRRVSLAEPTAAFKEIVGASKFLMRHAPIPARVSHMHVIAEKLSYRKTVQRSLFSSPKDERLDKIKWYVNRKIGRFSVRSGDTLVLDDVYADEANEYDICDIYGKMCF